MKFKVAAALATAALCAAVVSCSSGSAATASTQAPPVTVLTKGAGNDNGDIFLAPQGPGQYGTGPEIVSITGKVLWFHPLPAGSFATDFRTQTYLGKPVLTWFQGSSTGGEDGIYNARYQQIASPFDHGGVEIGNVRVGEGHRHRRSRDVMAFQPARYIINPAPRATQRRLANRFQHCDVFRQLQQRQGIGNSAAGFATVLPAHKNIVERQGRNSVWYDQKRPAGLKRQIANLDPSCIFEQRGAPIGAGNYEVSGAGLIGDIRGKRPIGNGRTPFQILHPPL